MMLGNQWTIHTIEVKLWMTLKADRVNHQDVAP